MYICMCIYIGFSGGAMVKNPPANAGDKRCGFHPWVRKIPWRREWQSTSVFLPVKSYGQRSLVGYSPWGHKESDMTEHKYVGIYLCVCVCVCMCVCVCIYILFQILFRYRLLQDIEYSFLCYRKHVSVCQAHT